MKEQLKSAGSVLFGIAISAGLLLLAAFLVIGGIKLSELIYPWLEILFAIAFFVSILLFLPLAFFPKTRGFSALGLLIASYVFGATLWVWAFLLTYRLWGLTALLIGLFMAGVGVVPIAMLATLFHGEWSILGQLILLLLFTFGSRGLSLYLAEKGETQSYE